MHIVSARSFSICRFAASLTEDLLYESVDSRDIFTIAFLAEESADRSKDSSGNIWQGNSDCVSGLQ